MKIIIDWTEEYPVCTFEPDKSSGRYYGKPATVTEEDLARYKQVFTAYREVQNELRALYDGAN